MPPKIKIVTRSYNIDYLKFGFITACHDERIPLCLLCKKTFSNEAMKPSRLKDHLSRVHSDKATESLAYFQKLGKEYRERATITSLFKAQNSKNEDGLEASYEIAALIAKSGKPHTIGENLIIPALRVVMKTMMKIDPHDVLSQLPLSNNSVSRRIDVMAANIEEQLVHKLQGTHFTMQLDESTVRDSEAVLLAYVRFIDDGGMKEEFLFARTLVSDTTGESIFRVTENYFAGKQIPVLNILACATDGAPSMVGCHQGFITRLKSLVPHIFGIHCMLHREHLAAKKLSGDLHHALQIVIRAVNIIKSNAKFHRLFKQLCYNEDENYIRLLMHTEVRWLSKGKCLRRFVELFDTVCTFLCDNAQFMELQDLYLKRRIYYLADIFDKLNQLNRDLQGTGVTLIHCKTKVLTFMDKLDLWRMQLDRRYFVNFASLNSVSNDITDAEIVCLTQHLTNLKDDMRKRYADMQNLDIPNWVTLPFDAQPFLEDAILQEELLELKNDSEAKASFTLRGYQSMWLQFHTRYPHLWSKVELLILAFPTTWLVEAGFSAVTNLLTKARNRLDICKAGDLRMFLTNMSPDIHTLVAGHQAQGSH